MKKGKKNVFTSMVERFKHEAQMWQTTDHYTKKCVVKGGIDGTVSKTRFRLNYRYCY